DISAVLIESNQKKAIFLREALKTTPGLQATVLPQRFESIDAPAVDFVTCRALERFEEMLPQLISWSPRPGQLLLFGGEGLGAKIAELGLAATKSLIPKSQKRFLFQIINS
ncbi:MAG TPA: RsmG family class I SAM-dependent methyltransferase, partial [Pyrinomonadaceae bacterium]|nr:RsmG family class I SAM-dependent methyltransferase [Pyrinomonadaceae bacterium]